MADDIPCCETKFFLFVLIIIGLVTFAGLMAGLTLGLMSLGLVDLEVLSKSGRPQDRIHASKILPVVKNQHLLLCTLLIGNSLAMELTELYDCLLLVVTSHILGQACAPWAAILVSVTLILMFGEILPQAICTRYGLTVGATTAPFVRLLLWLFFPVAYPISKFLDWMLGKGHAALLRRAELKTFVDFHGNEAGKGGDLTHDETTIIAGALEMTEKTAKDAMTPIAKAFSLDLDGTLNLETLNAIMTMGHSRVPVYYKNPNNIIGLILVKNLLAVDPDDSVPLRKMLIRKIPRVSENMPLYDILNEFQKGHSHLAVVYKDSKETKETLQKTKEDNQNFAIKSISNEADSIFNKADDQVKKSPPSTPAFKKRHRAVRFEEILDETDEYVNIHNRIRLLSQIPINLYLQLQLHLFNQLLPVLHNSTYCYINTYTCQFGSKIGSIQFSHSPSDHSVMSDLDQGPKSVHRIMTCTYSSQRQYVKCLMSSSSLVRVFPGNVIVKATLNPELSLNDFIAVEVNSGLAGFKFKLLSSQECAGVVA
ncbi:UNVERIFIED_CONTAM: DUF21 domain-containing protein [Sesamum radiatum]|uniref:DUF21 domain-containing protein n=1 Tax=Sesamum radiatum TaxID=300843 RepID=A0AAW2M437_SESRA